MAKRRLLGLAWEVYNSELMDRHQILVNGRPARRIDYVCDGPSYLLVSVGKRYHLACLLYKLSRSLSFTKQYIIYLLGIWKLADTPMGTIPQWKNVKGLRWLRKSASS